MKPILTILLCSLLLLGCKKEISTTNVDGYLNSVELGLKDSLSISDYSSLDFSKAVINRVDSVSLYLVRIPFRGKTIATNFVLVKTDRAGKIVLGKIIDLSGQVLVSGDGKTKQRNFEGSVEISSLDRIHKLYSPVSNGYIQAFHGTINTLKQTLKSADLPEVIVVAYVHYYDTGIDYSTWYLLTSLLDESGGGGSPDGGYYGSGGGGDYNTGGYYGGGGGGGGSYGGDGSTTVDPTMLVDVDTYVDHPAIDVEQYLKCFDNISDDGADCEIGIYADIPVDSDPNKIFDFSTGSPGHTFIQIKKVSSDGTKSVVQNIGFYPKTGWKSGLTNAPIDAKFVDDGMHEFNAGYTKRLTPDEFKSALTEIRYLKNMNYDIDNYNCTDWALAIFNKQGYGLDIPLYDIPGNVPSVGTSMPQGIYNKLMEMKTKNDTHSDKIQIGFYKGYVTSSNGPCN